MKTYSYIAQKLNAVKNCIASNNVEWQAKHTEAIDELIKDTAPSGSGIDSGTQLDWDKSSDEKLVFNADFHHMNDGGYYDGWTEHQIIITPSLAFGYSIKITGRDRNDIKEYLDQCFGCWLDAEVEEVKSVTV